jgi:1-deoxy-D-xylulose-5-phosphate synthase
MLSEKGINPEIVNMRFVRPIDTEMLDQIASEFEYIVTLEENSPIGGFGSAVLEYYNSQNIHKNVLRISLPDEFVEQGTQKELHQNLEIDANGIAKRIIEFIKK